ncbi:phage tail protein [Levilactobacillus enshiensis]|uniref:phage tail protein n=1 Tax=Levilactobacillus enshiensis TaxID=2590213 RepID=UPI00117A24D1|nr:phage tail protein [Levilactobacillus enshiensis]
MDLETLQVIFDVNTEKIQPKLDAMQRKFSGFFSKINGSSEKDMDVSKGQEKVLDQIQQMNDRTKAFMDKFDDILSGGSSKGVKALSTNVSRMKTSTMKDVSAMVSDINSKMESARAAEERMMNLKGLRRDALDVGDGKQASRINEQAASAEARMTRYQNQAKALAQELKAELAGIPTELTRIAHGMDENEGKIESLRRKIKGLEIAKQDAMKYDPAKGFNAEPSIETDQSRAIGERIQKERSAMQKLIDTSDALNNQYGRLEDRSGELKHAMGGLDTELGEGTKRTRTLRESFTELSSKLSGTASRIRSMMSALGRITGLSRLSRSFRQLNGDSRSLITRLGEVGSRGSSSMNKLSRGSRKAQSSLSELKQGLRSLPAQFIVWGIGFEAIQKFSQGLLNAAKSDRQFSNSLNQVKANLMTAFYPLYETIIPWLDSFMSTLAKATGWLAQFSAALFGMSNSAARSGAAGLYKQTKAMGDASNATSQATKAIQKQNAAITAHNRSMQQAVQKENQAIQKRNAARRKEIQDQNSQIRSANEKRKASIEAANEKIKASNKAVAEAVKKQNDAQKKRIAELKKKYQDYKNSLMGFDEINTLDLSKDIPDYTPKTAKQHTLKKYTATPTKDASFTPEETKTYTPEATKNASDLGYVPDGVDNALAGPTQAFGGAMAAAEKFKKVLADLFKPIKEAWSSEGKGVIDAFKYALKEVERLIGDIGHSFMTVWDSSIGVRAIKDVLKLLQTVLKIIGDIAKTFAEAWEDHGAGTKYIRSIFNALDAVLKVLNEVGKSFRKAWNDGTGERIAAHLLKLFTDLNKLIASLANSFRKAWTEGNTGTKLFSAWLNAFDKIIKFADDMVVSFRKAWNQANLGTKIFNNILNILKDVGKVIGNLAGGLDKAWKSGKTGQSIFHVILGIINDVLAHIKDMADATVTWSKKLDFRPLLNSIKGLFNSIRGLNKTVWDALDWGYKNVLLPLANFTITKALPAFFDLLSAAIKVVNSVLKALAPLGKALFDTFLKPIASFTGGSGIGAIEGISKALNGLAIWINKHQKAVQAFAKVLLGLFAFKVGTSSFEKGTSLVGKLVDKATMLSKNKHLLSEFFGKLTGISDLKKGFQSIKNIGKVVKVLAVDNWKNFVKDTQKLGAITWSKLSTGAGYAKKLALLSWSGVKTGAKYAGALAKISWSKLKAGGAVIVDVVKGIKNWSVWGKLAAGAQAALNAVMAVNPYVLLAAAIAAVVVVFVELYKHNKKFRKFVNNIYKAVTKWLGDALTWIKKNWGKIASFILNPVGSIATWFLKDTKTGKNIVKWGKARLKDTIDWAKDIGQGIHDKVQTGKKKLTKASTDIHDWLSGKAKKAFDAVKSKAKTLGADVHDKVGAGQKKLQKASSNIHSWLSTKAKDAFKTVSDKAKGLGKSIGDKVTAGKSKMSKASSNIHSWLSGKAKDAFKTVSDKAKGIGGYIHDKVSAGKGKMQKASSTIYTAVHDKAIKAFGALEKRAGKLTGNIASGLRKGIDGIVSAGRAIANAIVGTIGKAVNGVIDGLKWILSHVGAGTGGLSHWNVPRFAQGGYHHGGLAMVNDEVSGNYRESYQLPNGKQGIFPAVRNLMVNLPAGTKIKSARDTVSSIPHYKSGIGKFNFKIPKLNMPKFDFDLSGLNNFGSGIFDTVSDVVESVAGIIGSVWDDVKNPLRVIQTVASRYIGFGNLTGAGLGVAKGGVDMTEKGAVDTIKKALEDFANKVTAKKKKKAAPSSSSSLFGDFDFSSLNHLFDGFRNGGLVDKEGLYNLAEGGSPEIVLPLGQPQRAIQLIQQAISYMHLNPTGKVTMPTALSAPSMNLPATSGMNSVQGDGISGMQQAVVNAVMMAMDNKPSSMQNKNGEPIEITVKIGDETLGTHAIRGINQVNQRNGKNMLNL